jgi:hypothetical protein
MAGCRPSNGVELGKSAIYAIPPHAMRRHQYRYVTQYRHPGLRSGVRILDSGLRRNDEQGGSSGADGSIQRIAPGSAPVNSLFRA